MVAASKPAAPGGFVGPVFRRVGRRGLSALDLESRWHLQAAVGSVRFVACGRSGSLAVLLAPAEIRGGDTVPVSRPPPPGHFSFFSAQSG